MPINYDAIMKVTTGDLAFSYDDRDVILYALGVGFGRDPLKGQELPFVYEKDLKVVPTIATVWGWTQLMMKDLGIDFLKVVHGEQKVKLFRPLPPKAKLMITERVIGAFDKGKDKGAIILTEKVVREAHNNDPLCVLTASIFARGDGGFGGPSVGAPEPHKLPDHAPDLVVETETRPDQALLYALSGDRNPLHRDPDVARRAGFERPILHGLCTFGTACRAIIGAVCDYDADQVSGFDARFSAPVFPGETLVTEIWRDGNVVSFRSTSKERGVAVLNNGKCTLGFA